MINRELLIIREAVLDGIRLFFKKAGFIEVETPLFVPSADPEPTIEPFTTQLELMDGSKLPGFLITSPEFAMKQLLAAGSGSIFQITKAFRNGEPPSSRHNSEFTILEWYRTEAAYEDIMVDCEQLILFLLRYVTARRRQAVLPLATSGLPEITDLPYQGLTINLAAPWERVSVLAAFNQFAGIDEATFFDRGKFGQTAQAKGYSVTDSDTLLDLQTQILVQEIEPQLGRKRPTFLYDYPAEQAALARKKSTDSRLAERFELYIAGLELGNAFSELADPAEQEQRLQSQMEERQHLGKRTWKYDRGLIEALQSGIPSTGGIAVGVDRLVMLLANVPSIQGVLAFPQANWFERD